MYVSWREMELNMLNIIYYAIERQVSLCSPESSKWADAICEWYSLINNIHLSGAQLVMISTGGEIEAARHERHETRILALISENLYISFTKRFPN
jgi:hypothetical protein